MQLPVMFLKFWFFEAPKEIVLYFISLDQAFLNLFSLPLFIRTYFKPLKNEYRKGLVAFSIGMGISIKTILIFVDLLLLSILVFIECVLLLIFIGLPFFALLVLFL